MFQEVKQYLNPKNLLVIRSSIYPGTCLKIQKYLGQNFKIYLTVPDEWFKESQ